LVDGLKYTKYCNIYNSTYLIYPTDKLIVF
jgi:hypothetical protein